VRCRKNGAKPSHAHLHALRHLCRSEATSSLLTERRFSAIRVVSEAFIQSFVLVFDSKHWLNCGDLIKRGLHPRSTYNSVSANRLSLQRCTKLLMDDHCHNIEFKYDSGDKSPGTRLMRYYVSDDPRPDPLHRYSKDPDDTQSKQPVSTPSTAQQVSAQSKESLPRKTMPLKMMSLSMMSIRKTPPRKTMPRWKTPPMLAPIPMPSFAILKSFEAT
jgi:hypothetical protein